MKIYKSTGIKKKFFVLINDDIIGCEKNKNYLKFLEDLNEKTMCKLQSNFDFKNYNNSSYFETKTFKVETNLV